MWKMKKEDCCWEWRIELHSHQVAPLASFSVVSDWRKTLRSTRTLPPIITSPRPFVIFKYLLLITMGPPDGGRYILARSDGDTSVRGSCHPYPMPTLALASLPSITQVFENRISMHPSLSLGWTTALSAQPLAASFLCTCYPRTFFATSDRSGSPPLSVVGGMVPAIPLASPYRGWRIMRHHCFPDAMENSLHFHRACSLCLTRSMLLL